MPLLATHPTDRSFPLVPAKRAGASAFPPSADGRQRWPVAILGVVFDSVDMDEALAGLARLVASGRPHYVVTPNVDFLVRARRDAELRRILLEAHLVLCDGMPLVWASRWLGNPLPSRVAGADLAPRLLAQAERLGHRIYLLGATPEANAAAVQRLRECRPGLVVAGHHAPPFGPLEAMDNAGIVRRIREARADIVLVSFGCPKQEKWIARHYREIGAPVCIGVGAVIDFLAGRVRRAPPAMRRLGLEWVYRLLQEPRRLAGRYAEDLWRFGPAILAQCWHDGGWRHGAARGWAAMVRRDPDWNQARAAGPLNRASIESAAGAWRRIAGDEHNCVLNLAGVNHLDCTGAALLLRLKNLRQESGHRLLLESPSAVVRRALARMGLLECFEIRVTGAAGGAAPGA